jgi:hypothetical protein
MEIMLNGPVIAGYEVYEDFYLYKKGTFVDIVYFFLVGGCARHLQNPVTTCDLPIGYSIPLTNREVAFRCRIL